MEIKHRMDGMRNFTLSEPEGEASPTRMKALACIGALTTTGAAVLNRMFFAAYFSANAILAARLALSIV